MATPVIHIIDPDMGTGWDYSSLAAWDSAQARNLITADEIAIAKCRSTGGSADTSAVVIASPWVADSTRYIQIWTDPSDTGGDGPNGSYRHNGVFPGSGDKIYRIINTSGTYSLDIQIDFSKILGICVNSNFVSSSRYCIYLYASTIYVAYSIAYISNTGSSCVGIGTNIGVNTQYIYNNIVYNCNGYGIFVAMSSGQVAYLYNNTIYNCGIGIYNPYGTDRCVAINNISYNNTTDFSGTFPSSSDYNFSKDDTAPGDNSIHGDTDGKTPDFVNTGTGDFHLQGTSDAIGAGTDDPGSGLYSDDIDGNMRS